MNDELSAPKLTKLAETIGFEITEFTPGKCIVELTIREDHLNAGGVAHGGLLSLIHISEPTRPY